MREYLFHGKRTDNGEWVEGYLGVFKGTPQIYVPFTEEEEKENEGHFLSAIGGLWYTVIPESVGEWTGIYDINQRKIFENDIVRTQPYLDRPYSKNKKSKQFIGVVEYYTRHFKNSLYEQVYDAGWQVKVKDYGKYVHGSWSDFYKCEVIGTVFENSDLLEG
jgi:uncharacterized phage protein (TIGR01671 family)